MKHERIYIGTALFALWVAGCTNEGAPGNANEPEGTSLVIRAAVRTGENGAGETAYEAFPEGKRIHIYYAHNNLEQAYDFLQGIYAAPAGNDKETNWIPEEWKPDAEAASVKSIYVDDIKAPNSDGKYFFTATSYPEPRVKDADGCVYEVAPDQTALAAGFGKYDFLAARAVYPDDSWKAPGKGITLHFRHLLSQLRVQLVLPEGSAADGFFPSPSRAAISVTLKDKRYRYTVTYNNRTETAGIFGIGMPENGGVGDVKLRADGVTGPLTVNGHRIYSHTFSAILPKQTLYGGKLLSFTVNGKPYSYTPPEANTVLLEQEKITTIQLTVLSGPGNQKVTLNNVTLEDWKEDKAEVGDLIPQ